MFLEILQNSQENTCVRVSFLIKLQASDLQLYWKRDSDTGGFLWILWNFYEHSFLQNTSGGCFCFFKCLFSYFLYASLYIIYLRLYFIFVFNFVIRRSFLQKRKKEKEKEKIFIESHKKIWEIVVLTDRCIVKKMISKKM